MKLLDIPYGLCDHVECAFHPETWEEFDRTVVWLVKEGCPLEIRDENWDKHRVFIRGKHPYSQGKILNVTLQKLFGHVDAVEGAGVEYTVYMPQFIRT